MCEENNWLDRQSFEYTAFRFRYLRNCTKYGRQFDEQFCWWVWVRV